MDPTFPPPDAQERVKALQEATGVRSAEQCEQVLAAHSWDLNEAAAFLLALSAEDDTPQPGPTPSVPHLVSSPWERSPRTALNTVTGASSGGGSSAAGAFSQEPQQDLAWGSASAYSSGANSLRGRAVSGSTAVASAPAAPSGSAPDVGGGAEWRMADRSARGNSRDADRGELLGATSSVPNGVANLQQPAHAQQLHRVRDSMTVGIPPSEPENQLSSNHSASATAPSRAQDWRAVEARASSRTGVPSGSLPPPRPTSFLARVFSLPMWLFQGSLGAVAGVFALGLWAAGGALSFLLSRVLSVGRWPGGRGPGQGRPWALPARLGGVRAVTLPEAAIFRQRFEAEYGTQHLEFFPGTFQEALRRAAEQFRFLLVYLHAPEHVRTPRFCRDTLCDPGVVSFLDDNFVVWGGDVRGSEGFHMCGRLNASTFPFCAVLTSTGSNRATLLRAMEGPLGPGELVGVLQRVLEEQGALLVAARADEEERNLSRRLREEQDAAYQAALRADQEKERLKEEEERRRAAEEEERQRQQREEEQRTEAAARAAAERQAAVDRRRAEAAARLPAQPEKGPGSTQVVIRLPGGERLDRRFLSSAAVDALYDFVDSQALGTPSLPSQDYSLVSNFPRTVYGPATRARSLADAGLHPQASLFVLCGEGGAGRQGSAGAAAGTGGE